MGKITATFETADTDLCQHNGERVIVNGEIDPDLYDRDDVGVMHYVTFPDGIDMDVFNDELTEWRLEK